MYNIADTTVKCQCIKIQEQIQEKKIGTAKIPSIAIIYFEHSRIFLGGFFFNPVFFFIPEIITTSKLNTVNA